MLNENQINFLPERIQERLNKINAEYFESVGKTLKKIGELRPSDVHKLQQIYDYGAEADKIAKKLAAASSKNIDEIYQIYDIVAKDNYDFAKPFYKAKGIPHPVYKDNKKLKDYVRSIAKQTVDEYVNLTQHTAFAIFDKTGKSIAPLFETNKNKLATSLSDTYTKIVDYAVTKVQLGEESYQNAVQEVCKAMVNSGIKTVDYATGYSRRLDSAVRQNVLWGLKQCNQNTAEMIGEEFGADGYEVSYHSNPRESHADMAGKQFAKGKARTIDGVFYPSFEEVAKPLLEEYGCLHFYYPILLGISSPAYSKEQLEELKANDNKTFEFEGKKYTGYEAEQTQRKLETAIRHNRDLIISAKAAGSKALENEARENIDILARKYKKFSDAAGLPTQMERTQLAVKKVDKSVESGIINIKINNNVVVNPMDKDRYQKMSNGLMKSGIKTIEAKGDDLRYLKAIGAEASYGHGYIMHLGEIPSASAMFEEIIHSTQAKKYGEFDSSDIVELCAREIPANRMLIKNGKLYGFDNVDFDDIESNLKHWEELFRKEVGCSYDESSYRREI